MNLSITKRDIRVMSALAEYRVLTVSQMVGLLDRNDRALRRRLNEWERAGLVKLEPVDAVGRGRPELQVSLTGSAVELLRTHSELAADVSADLVLPGNLARSSHHRLVNWFRVYVTRLSRLFPELTTSFLSPNSPTLPRDETGRPMISDSVCLTDRPDLPVRFTPDGVFMIRHEERQKSMLFFLEVDMGTETLAGSQVERGSVEQKVINYQAYWGNERYKRYESNWHCRLNGFRLLILSNTCPRLESLCRLVCRMPPSDFIWLTGQEHMFAQGLAAEIWTRGGKLDAPLYSILGPELSQKAQRPA